MIFRTATDQLERSSLDETLVEYTRLGSETAFAVLVGRHGDIVYTILWNMCATPSETDELTLQTLVRACREIRTVGLNGSFRTRLCTLAIETALAVRRRPSSAVSLQELAPSRGDAGCRRLPIAGDWRDLTDPALQDDNLAVQLREALERMEDDVRAAFVLCDLAELPAEEAASALQTSAPEIRHRVHRARLALIGVLDGFFVGSQA